MEAPKSTAPGVGKCNLRCGMAGAGLGVPRPVTKLRLWSSQTLGHPGTAGSLKRAENRLGLRAGDSI